MNNLENVLKESEEEEKFSLFDIDEHSKSKLLDISLRRPNYKQCGNTFGQRTKCSRPR
jgi:hypothetical protein